MIHVRRMIGVAAALYAVSHLITYAADKAFMLDRVVSEIFVRTYLTIGFAGLILFLALLATSTDGMVRRLGGKKWRLLHRFVYAIGAIAVVHFVWQSKLDVTQPAIMAGLFLWLMAYRLMDVWVGERGRLPIWAVIGLAPGAALLTALGEALYFWLRNGVDPGRVLLANLMLGAGLRPGWTILAIVGGLAVISLLRRLRGAFQTAPRPASAAR
ncbi:MAG: sulfoxide reductase heme-binding subunit YedZ [Alphaproteobacteria bacterium]|nr:sulfoxide reductase heme-binding subunit YedZ [Alphaproteobacteria bacterium]